MWTELCLWMFLVSLALELVIAEDYHIRCKLPSQPDNGWYNITHGIILGGKAPIIILKYSCDYGYELSGNASVFCIGQTWNFETRPKCVRANCGQVPPNFAFLISNGRNTQIGELPWHTGIYDKTYTPYKQICGGSLVSTKVVISAAHCFCFNSEKQPASNFAVAVGKLYRPWNNRKDKNAQKSDVSEIKIPIRFRGSISNYANDIALVVLTVNIEYTPYVNPVCLDFNVKFDRQQLQPGNLGKVTGWGLTGETGTAAPILQVLELPYVDYETCIRTIARDFVQYVSNDKICGGYTNGSTVCRGDSGGGFVFPQLGLGEKRFYLRGVVSVAPKGEKDCHVTTLTAFTHVIDHEEFIKETPLI